jgi:hypothetical protein
VKDRVDAVERPANRLRVADVSNLEFYVGMEIAGPQPARPVNLRGEAIETTDPIAPAQEFVGYMGADEPRTSSDENSFGHRT